MNIHGIPKKIEWQYPYNNGFAYGYLAGYRVVEIIPANSEFYINEISQHPWDFKFRHQSKSAYKSLEEAKIFCENLVYKYWIAISDFQFLPEKTRLQNSRKVYSSFTKNKRKIKLRVRIRGIMSLNDKDGKPISVEEADRIIENLKNINK